MQIRLIEIPGIEANHETEWRIRVLEIDQRNLVLSELNQWRKSSPADYKKIMKVLRMIGQFDRIRDEKKVKKSANPKHDGVYEIRADKGHARLLFFYDRNHQQAIIVCTNTYWKTKSSQKEQAAAFANCHRLKEIYEKTRRKN